MSGQYPPPNPYSGHHQRAPPSPWAHSHPRHPQSHPSGMVWSPHVGLPARGAQMWTPKPVDSRPLYGLQMMMGSSQYSQQEETMDLSASAQDVPKAAGDPLRNGTVNGEAESIVTSVIATNPLRETSSTPDPLNCTKRVEETSNKIWESSDHSVSVREPDKSFTSSNLVPEEAAVELVSKNESTDLDRLSDFSFSGNFVKETEEQSSQSLESVNKNFDDSNVEADKHTNPNESHSYFDNSYLSVDTDESRLVVAESSAEDIFGISPVDNVTNMTSQETVKTDGLASVISSSNVADNSTPTEQWPLRTEMPAVPTTQSLGPDPSVENVEILLESMFNSQEETSCSSQTSSSGVPHSVIVSNGTRLAAEATTLPVERTSPMKEEELAKTLAEDSLIDSDIQEESKLELKNKDNEVEGKELLNDIKEETASCNENPVPDVPNTDDLTKENMSQSEAVVKDSEEKKINKESIEGNLPNSIPEPTKEENLEENDNGVGLLPPITDPSTSSNPFIEVETQLEKMFAGIVEPVDEVSSDAVAQPLSTESTKLTPSKKATRKRKRTNNRRPSDNSVFGGSSGDSVPLKKKGRKRIRDSSGNEKGSKKIKMEFGEISKKGKAMKENLNDGPGSKVKGPFVHIEGSKESPASVVVVNSGSRADDDDGVDKVSNRWKHSARHKSEGVIRKAGPAYNSSTLSMRYNSDTPDVTWVCVFCKRGPHCVGGFGGEPAGDLFGPYRVPLTPPNDDTPLPGTPSDQEIAEEQKRRSGGKFPKSLRACDSAETFVAKVAKKGKRSASHDGLDYQPGLLPVEDSYEVWLHEQCAVWAPGLCIIGTQLVGLDDTVWASLKTKCWQCGLAGAGLGCVVHNCPSRMHYPCAKVCGWLLDPDTFIARCQTHRTRLRP